MTVRWHGSPLTNSSVLSCSSVLPEEKVFSSTNVAFLWIFFYSLLSNDTDLFSIFVCLWLIFCLPLFLCASSTNCGLYETKQLDSPFTNNTNPKPQPRRQNSSTVSQNGGSGGDSIFATPVHQKQSNGGTSAEKMPKNGVTTNGGTENNKNGSASKDKNVDEGLVALRRQPSIRDRRKVGAWPVSDWCRCNNKNEKPIHLST